MSPPLPESPERIYVRLPTWVGDVVMATPVLRALRARYPGARISVEGRRLFAPLVEELPSVDAFLPDPGREWAAVWRHAQRLREDGFAVAVLLPDSLRVAVAPCLARIPHRVGYARDVGRRLLLTHALDPPTHAGQRVPISMVERYLRIVRTLGCRDPEPGLDLVVSAQARESLGARLRGLGVGEPDAIVTVTPGAAFGASKLWPPEHFAAACDALHRDRGWVPVLAPGPGEEPIASEIAERASAPVRLLADPPSTLAELAALIERSALVLTNDTGPRHMAVALGVPVVTVMGPTDPRHTAHLLERQAVLREDVDCSPCHQKVCPIDHRCMVRLSPDRVVAAARRLVA